MFSSHRLIDQDQSGIRCERRLINLGEEDKALEMFNHMADLHYVKYRIPVPLECDPLRDAFLYMPFELLILTLYHNGWGNWVSSGLH